MAGEASILAKRAFLRLELFREPLMAGLRRLRRARPEPTLIEGLARHPTHPKSPGAGPLLPSRRTRLYEARCLGIEVTRVAEERLSRALKPASRAWAEPWGRSALWQHRTDLKLLDADRRRLGRWLGPRTRARAETRARERLERIVAEVDEQHRRDLARAVAVKKYGRFAGGRFADRRGGDPDAADAANGNGDRERAEIPRQPLSAPADSEAGPWVPTRRLRAAIGGALALALIAVAALLVSALRSNGAPTPSPTASFLGIGKDIASDTLPQVSGATSTAAVAERRAERRREQAREAEDQARVEARATAAREDAAPSTTEARTPTTESAEPELATIPPAPEPASTSEPAPAPTPIPVPAAPAAAPAPESSPAPTRGGGGGSECFTFEC